MEMFTTRSAAAPEAHNSIQEAIHKEEMSQTAPRKNIWDYNMWQERMYIF